jgi:hypothetical protein
MSLIWLYAAAIFALINTVLITFLLSLYSTSYRKVRSTFTVGLIIFVLFSHERPLCIAKAPLFGHLVN